MRSTLLVAILGTCLTTTAQELKLPSWMLRSMARMPTQAEHPQSDSLLYAAFGADSMHANQFIGTWSGKVNVTKQEERQEVGLSGWSDTARALLRVQFSDIGELIYMVDLRANTVVLVAGKGSEWKGNVMKLQDVIVVNALIKSAVLQDRELMPTGNKRTIGGARCAEYIIPEGADTIHVWTDAATPSLYRDAVNWAPMMSSPFNLVGLMADLSAETIRLMTSKETSFELTSLKVGRFPPPTIDLSKAELKDDRKDPGQTLTILPGPDPFWTEPRSALDEADEESIGAPMIAIEKERPPPVSTPPVAKPWFKVDLPEIWLMKAPVRPADLNMDCVAVLDFHVDRNGIVTWAKVDRARTTCPASDHAQLIDLAKTMGFRERTTGRSVEPGTVTFRFTP